VALIALGATNYVQINNASNAWALTQFNSWARWTALKGPKRTLAANAKMNAKRKAASGNHKIYGLCAIDLEWL
jgi:hypothetical protein